MKDEFERKQAWDSMRARRDEIEQRAQAGSGDRIDDLTVEDEKILDRVWEEIRVEDEAKKAARRARRRKAAPGSAPE